MSGSISGTRVRLVGGILLLAAVPLWVRWATPWLLSLPSHFRYDAEVFSQDNLFDEKQDRFSGEMLSHSRFYYETIGRDRGVQMIRNVFDVRKTSGQKIFSVERILRIDPRTQRHVAGGQGRVRKGYLFGPRGVGKEAFTYWHVNYDVPARMVYDGSQILHGLSVNRYVCHFQADQTDELTHLPGVPAKRGVILDIELTLWIEPVSGWLVQYNDRTLASFYDRVTGYKLYPWNRFENRLTVLSVMQQVRRATWQKWKVRFVEYGCPLLLGLGAFSLLFLGSVLRRINLILLWARSRQRMESLLLSRYAPVVVGVFLLMTVMVLWLFLRQHARQQLDHTFSVDRARLSEHLGIEMENRISALRRLAARWNRPGMTTTLRAADVNHYLHDFPDYQAIAWIDSSFRVQWIAPLESNPGVVGFNLASEERRMSALIAARDRKDVSVTHPITLIQGEKGFLLCIPLFNSRGVLDGFIVGVFRYQRLFDRIMRDWVATGQGVVILDHGEEIYRQGDQTLARSHWAKPTDVLFPGSNWQMVIWPHPEWVMRESSLLPLTVLLMGAVVSGLVAFAFYFAARAIRQRRSLEQEVLERRRIESKLQRFTQQMELANHELQKFNRVAVGREQRMIELKRQINELSVLLGRPAPYDLSFAEQKAA